MKLGELPKGEKVFIDANIFLSEIFDEQETADECMKFLERIKNAELKGYPPHTGSQRSLP
ncbi:MAG: hypothetical protein JW778_03785 [Candidatus Altiarchaeota archaeon]|nr:hypothetical protein [Candidatus Altiarchaeota archaeon]